MFQSSVSSDSDESGAFRINKNYADKYNKWRGLEELQKYKDKHGEKSLDRDEESSSSSESEDEDGEALTAEVEQEWLRAYAAVKTKDPRIYSKDVNFFSEKDSAEGTSETKKAEKKKNKDKPMYLKDFERKVILERGGKLEDDDDECEKRGFTYSEEQEALRKSLKDVAKVDSDSDVDDEFLVKRKKTPAEQEKEEADYSQWLNTQSDDSSDEKKVGVELKELKKYWNDPNLDDGEKFLKDYILNKRYIEEHDEDRIPTYEEIVKDELSEDEAALEKQEHFEHKFNFRYEEPDSEFIKSYPRTISDTLRRKDDRRVKQRQVVKDRKDKETDRKREELKQMKNIKKKQIMDKLETLKEITGNPTVGFNEDDIEGDFDPAEYDKKMQAVFNDEYYDIGDDAKKPVFNDDYHESEYNEDENWDNWTGEGDEYYGNEDEMHFEDPNFNMDCDYDPEQETVRGSKKNRKKSKFAIALSKKKHSVKNKDDKTFEEYFEEYYRLDYEDMIGDIPCRFKYRKVEPNDFGLTTEEVLKCEDKELNSWVSLKKTSQYRTLAEEQIDKRIFAKKARNSDKKFNILATLKDELEGKKVMLNIPTHESLSNNKRKRESCDEPTKHTSKQKSKKKRSSTVGVNPEAEETSGIRVAEVPRKRNKAKKKEKLNKGQLEKSDITEVTDTRIVDDQQSANNTEISSSNHTNIKTKPDKTKSKKKKKSKKPVVSDERLKAYGIDPRRFKYMKIKKFEDYLKST